VLDGGVARDRDPNLHFTTALEEAIGAAEMVLISASSPTKTETLGPARPAIKSGCKPM
jgi:hypothetical protein